MATERLERDIFSAIFFQSLPWTAWYLFNLSFSSLVYLIEEMGRVSHANSNPSNVVREIPQFQVMLYTGGFLATSQKNELPIKSQKPAETRDDLNLSIFNEQINITECYQPSFKLFQITGLPPFVIIWVKYLPCSVIYKSPGSWYALSWKVNDTILRNIFTLVKEVFLWLCF